MISLMLNQQCQSTEGNFRDLGVFFQALKAKEAKNNNIVNQVN